MAIKNLRIQNFRGFKELEVKDFGARINILFGENNCGKTSSLEAIYLLFGDITPSRLRLDSKKVHLEVNELTSIFYNFITKNEVNTKVDFVNEKNEKFEIEAKLFTRESKRFNKSKEMYKPFDIDNAIFIDYLVDKINNRKNETILENKFNVTEEKVYKSNDGSIARRIIRTNFNKAVKKMTKLSYIISNEKIDKEISSSIDYLMRKTKTDYFVNILKRIYPKINDIRIGSNNNIYLDVEGLKEMLPIEFMGDGIIKSVYIISKIIANEDGIVLIDEIDNGLHYTAQKILWKAIIEISKEYNVQIIATTHNIEMLKYLSEVGSEYDKKTQKDISGFNIVNREGLGKSYKYKFEDFKSAIDAGLEIR